MYHVKVNEITTMKQGDTKRVFTAQIIDSTNTPVILTGASVTLYIAKRDAVVLQKTATITSATQGEVSFSFSDEDVTGNGNLDAEFLVVFSDQTKITAPTNGYVKIKINQQLPDRGNETITPSLYTQVVEAQTEQDAKINAQGDEIDVLSDVKVLVESFEKEVGETDDTARLQRAIDAAPEYAEIILNPKKTYEWTSLTSTKSLVFNINGANIIVNPHETLSPAIQFKGTVSQKYALTQNANKRNILITVANASTLFTRNDYIILGDNKVTPSWDGNGFNYTGQSEMNIVVNVSGDNIILAKPCEWDYFSTEGAYIQKITKLLKSPKVINTGVVTEVDPGVPSPTANPEDGHLFHFQYAILPSVENFRVDKWQLHIVNFHYCIHGLAKQGQAFSPFRPENGGHGYVVRYGDSWGGVASELTAHHARHVVDWSKSYDGISMNNFSYFPFGVSYAMHGLGAKRCKSINDTVRGADTNSEGWSMGNPVFNADYDYQIINPSYRGEGIAIGMKTLSDGMKVINPDIATNHNQPIAVTRGAKNFIMEGGSVENYHPTGQFRFGIMVRANSADTDPAVFHPSNITIRHTKFKGNAMVYVDAKGRILIDTIECDVTIVPNNGLGGAIRVSATQAAEDLSVIDCLVKGTFDRGVYHSTAPTRFYKIEGNQVSNGFVNAAYQLRADSKLRFQNNDCETLTNAISFSGDIAAAKTAGAIVKNNRPSTFDS